MSAPLSDPSRNAAWKLLLIAAALMPAFGIDAIAQNIPHGFPVLAPIEDADPAIRHKETIQVPTKLVFTRREGQLRAEVDNEGFKPVEISVGLKMIIGARIYFIVYPATQPRPAEPVESWDTWAAPTRATWPTGGNLSVICWRARPVRFPAGNTPSSWTWRFSRQTCQLSTCGCPKGINLKSSSPRPSRESSRPSLSSTANGREWTRIIGAARQLASPLFGFFAFIPGCWYKR